MTKKRGKNKEGAGYVTLSARIPEDVRLAFRIATLENDTTVNDVIEMLARAYADGRLVCDVSTSSERPTSTERSTTAEDVQAMTPADFERVRGDLEMSQRAISEAAKLNKSSWRNYETKGRTPDYEAATKIAAYLSERGVKTSQS